MKTFLVNVREVHIQTYKIVADNEVAAKEKVRLGEGNPLEDMLEFSHALRPEFWTVEEES